MGPMGKGEVASEKWRRWLVESTMVGKEVNGET